jgi:DNA-directed RNA polymerase subunit RPC12/RpoP
VIHFKCGGCGKPYNVQPAMAGKQARCKQCGVTFKVPSPKPAAADAVGKIAPASPPRPAVRAGQAPAAAPRSPKPASRPPSAGARPAPRPAPPSLVAPDDDPLGLGLDLDALGPLGGADFGGADLGGAGSAGSLLAPAASARGGYRPKKKSNLGFWLLLGGGGVAIVGLIAGVIVLVINSLPAKTTVAANAEAFMPANWSVAGSARLRPIIEWTNTVPTFKARMDNGLAAAQAQGGIDFRKIDELLLALDGKVLFVAMAFSEAVDTAQLLKTDRPIETYRGLQLYEGNQASPQGMPGALPSSPLAPQKMYSVSPSDKLLIGVSDLARLKAAVDQALDGRGGKFDLPRQKPLVFRVKDVKDLMGGAPLPPNPMTDGIVGGTASIDLSKDLNVEAVLDMKDAQAATNLQSQLNGLLMLFSMKMPAELKPLIDSLKIVPSGSQLQFTISVPAELMAKTVPAGPMPMGGFPGQPPMSQPLMGQPPMGQPPMGQPVPGQ